CYRRGGPLTVTDANLLLGRIQPQFFPKIFGSNFDLPLDKEIVTQKFEILRSEIQETRKAETSQEEVAEGYLRIAVEIMASAVRQISTEKGHDLSEYALCAFGGAGGQHACLMADELNIKTIILHPLQGVLSAFGIGIADTVEIQQLAIEEDFTDSTLEKIQKRKIALREKAVATLTKFGFRTEDLETAYSVRLRYKGTDSTISTQLRSRDETIAEFEEAHTKRFGFITPQKTITIESLQCEVTLKGESAEVGSPGLERIKHNLMEPSSPSQSNPESTRIYSAGQWHSAQIFQREGLQAGDVINGPAIITEATATTVVDLGWSATVDRRAFLILTKMSSVSVKNSPSKGTTHCEKLDADPIKLELFSNRLMTIAEEMGIVLQNTSHSVNIKERLDFSCAIFDRRGQLIANAPHIPVHLGSMSESVQSLIKEKGSTLAGGDTFIVNNPYLGGTHLPDVTAISPVFLEASTQPDFFVASRGHHADIGGITPGSMPPNSTNINQEGIIFSHFQLAKDGKIFEQELRNMLTASQYPARNPDQNVFDLTAQIAANNTGISALKRLCERYGLDTVEAYMQFVRDNAASAVRKALSQIRDGAYETDLDDGSKIRIAIQIDRETNKANIDFSGTSGQHSGNMNAPLAISKAALLYVFRTIVKDNIPLNDGCIEPINYSIPPSSLLNPTYPAAVVAGNVETSQLLVDCLYAAMDVMAASQGTMNNLTFGNEQFQYYETICGGSGAGPGFNGASAVHTHMTNSRLTDPEILELRYPVLVKNFAIRNESGGVGEFFGGDGVVRKLQFLCPMTVSILSQRRHHGAFGLHGGQSGQAGRNLHVKASGDIVELPATVSVQVTAGDCIQIETPGGGGWGIKAG
ncbi:MAG: hydantoinase B/oxoprolinase family protein, partial [Leptolyngbya sp.]|nr:hydantoinase B/oxoprolinase family protein [Candidatus Melainabacteria bacterium]